MEDATDEWQNDRREQDLYGMRNDPRAFAAQLAVSLLKTVIIRNAGTIRGLTRHARV